MFEKSLYDLIRGLRNHKGNEREYIQNALRECRAEIRGADMDVKATALLKLVYLEMFGHDMSWASFNVLEVMSSPKYPQKRVGYLSAVQSFRPDTEVLMLATNLLKKDIASASIPTISLPLVTLPHVITPSLAMSILNDLIPRMSHSNPNIRKKAVVTVYRLALVYPETLRPSWPKIKEMLMDEKEDPSVTAAVINVICELGWRRPRDFLPLAPRLFDLLVDGGNNWMAIKIIKLFATLTPLEPRLVRKLLPPLAKLIQTTPAMSLLYECINGIIQGGIFEDNDRMRERDEIAELCVGKLRGMLAIEGDPNLKYVALLAFNKIVVSHPHLVSMQQDVIMSCIDDADISIRMQALNLSSGMIDGDKLPTVVNRLTGQLKEASVSVDSRRVGIEPYAQNIEPAADSDSENPEQVLRSAKSNFDDVSHLPVEYKVTLIQQILEMCARDTYMHINDFEWYVDTLVEIVRLVPSVTSHAADSQFNNEITHTKSDDVSSAIGMELRNVAVRVSSVRHRAVRAAESLLSYQENDNMLSGAAVDRQGVLLYAAWIVGEYPSYLLSREETLNALLLSTLPHANPDIVCAYIQAVPKIIASMFSPGQMDWNAERQTMTSLLLARIVHFFEPLTVHPNLEVQERAVEFLELMRLASEAVVEHSAGSNEIPLILSNVMPSLFGGMELKPVSSSAQRKIPLPHDIDLHTALNPNLGALLNQADQTSGLNSKIAEIDSFYSTRPKADPLVEPIIKIVPDVAPRAASYQNLAESVLDLDTIATQRAERLERQKDDPFYIGPMDDTGRHKASVSLHNFPEVNFPEFDVDSIPIMSLELGESTTAINTKPSSHNDSKRKARQKVHVAAEETLDEQSSTGNGMTTDVPNVSAVLGAVTRNKAHKGLLQVDSSGLGGFSLDDQGNTDASEPLEYEKNVADEAEMARALAEVERLRMEMQRASERIRLAEDIPQEGTLIKKKRKKKKSVDSTMGTSATRDSEAKIDDPLNEINPSTAKRKSAKRKKRKPTEGQGEGFNTPL